MAMNFLKLRLLSSTAAIIIITFSHPLISLLANCSSIHHHTQPSDTITQGSLFEGKTRLGSTPPSCHNKCNQCHPCLAVQVPTMPSHDDRFRPGLNRVMPVHYFDSSPSNMYSNYKPLGWKCRCGDHFFNP